MSWRVPLKQPIYTIFGANTGVGKTIISTLLVKALAPAVNYIKPVSTGPLSDADYLHVHRYVPSVPGAVLYQFDEPCSPHLAAGSHAPTDDTIRTRLLHHLTRPDAARGMTLIESAGGVHSPTPSGTSQMSLYRPLRLPVVLVADTGLGGISTTRSAYDTLTLHGFDVAACIGFKRDWGNMPYLAQHLPCPMTCQVPNVPEAAETREEDEERMRVYYDLVAKSSAIAALTAHLQDLHEARVARLREMPGRAVQRLWYPFTQHGLVTQEAVTTIDSAYGDDFTTVHQGEGGEDSLRPVFDGSASWWTQGLGHGNHALAMTAAYAASRYGHVILPNTVNEPALALAERLLDTVGRGWAGRVYYSDNGATAIEVALKMALKAARVRYGGTKEDLKLGIIGMTGSYHGDTIGAMDASDPNVYNEQVDWYRARGLFFEPPSVAMTRGKWVLTLPESLRQQQQGEEEETFESLDAVFDLATRKSSATAKAYATCITHRIKSAVEQGQKFGALLFEPILMGAGGMIFVDPLFQHLLTQTVRAADFLCPANGDDWSGLPVITDEVFTGLYRLSQPRTFDLLQILPDISVNAKLLTGGVVPLSTTMASESIFNTFLKSEKKDALLHGHSYTAHPIGTSIALASLTTLDALHDPSIKVLDDEVRDGQVTIQNSREAWHDSPIHSIWDPQWIKDLSHHPKIDCVVCLGSVVAMTLKDEAGGYSSFIASSLVRALREHGSTPDTAADRGLMVRPLGNVVYIMASQVTAKATAREIQATLLKCLSTA